MCDKGNNVGDPTLKDCGVMISWCFSGGYCIEKVLLFPSCIIALVMGITIGVMIHRWKNQFTSKFFYALCFYMFGAMMTVAGILHCFIHDENTGPEALKILRLIFVLTDFTLTTNIAVTFAFAGLADVHIWSWSNIYAKITTIITWVLVAIAWTYAVLTGFKKYNLFDLLYLKVIGVSGAIWFVTQVILFVFSGHKLTKKAKVYCLLCMVFASIGLIGIVPSVGNAFCRLVGKKFSSIIHPMVIWFYFSDFSMLYIGLFLIASKGSRELAAKYFLPN